MGNNVNVTKLNRMLKSKGFVTGLCAVLAVAILLIGYNVRVNDATKPMKVYVAARELPPRHLIVEEDITTIEMPKSALKGVSFYTSHDAIKGKYVKENTTIPAGSMFYETAIVKAEDIADSALMEIDDEEEVLYYLTVNMLTSYSNSILPNRYIDIYLSTKDAGQAMVQRFIKNVRVIQVKTQDGKNVFDGTQNEGRVPYVIIFALPKEQHLYMRRINAINNYAISSEGDTFSRIEVIAVPTSKTFTGDETDVIGPPTIVSDKLKEMIDNRSILIDETDDLSEIITKTE